MLEQQEQRDNEKTISQC